MFETKYDGLGKTKFLAECFGDITLGQIGFPLVILTSTIDGDPVLFKSWNPDQRKVKLCDVVDASTAAPIYFPPIKIGSGHYMDGGVVSNDPVLAGILTAREKWGNDVDLAVLSLGTGMISHINITDQNHPRHFGLVKWLSEGLVDIITRSNDKLHMTLIPLLIGDNNYLRITSTVTGNLDDASPVMQTNLIQNAADIWRDNESMILSWLADKKKSQRDKPKRVIRRQK